MSAVNALLALFVAALPVQRACLYFGAGLCVVAAVLAVVFDSSGPGALAALGLAFAGLATVPAGVLARVWAQSMRTHCLPRFRQRLLTAMFAVVWVPPVLAAGVVWLTGKGDPASVLIATAAILTGLMAGVFFAPVSIPFLIAFVIVMRFVDGDAFDAWLAGSGMAIVALAVIAGWALWAAWLLRGGRVEPFQFPRPFSEKVHGMALPERISPATAIAVRLCQPSPPTLLQAAFMAVFALALGGLLALPFDGKVTPILVPVMFVGSIPTLPVARQIARRSRMLWLASGMSRAALAATVERTITRAFAAGPLTFAVSIAAVCVAFGPIPWAALPASVAVLLLTSVVGGYLGMMAVQRFGPLDVLLIAIWIALAGMASVSLLLASYDRLLAIAALLAVLAVVARGIALRRWRVIDWIEARPAVIPRPRGLIVP